MDTIDITIIKNKLQILIYQSQENIKKQKTAQRIDALETLTGAYSVIVELQNALEKLKHKHLIAEQNNIKAYRENVKFKRKINNFI